LQATAQLGLYRHGTLGHCQWPMTHVTHPKMVTHDLIHFQLCLEPALAAQRMQSDQRSPTVLGVMLSSAFWLHCGIVTNRTSLYNSCKKNQLVCSLQEPAREQLLRVFRTQEWIQSI